MSTIRIILKSDLCLGSGESVGCTIDSDICMDSYGFPIFRGRRLLGCLRETAEYLAELAGIKEKNDLLRKKSISENEPEEILATEEDIREIFGDIHGREGKLKIYNGTIKGINSARIFIDDLKHNSQDREYLIRQSTKEKVIEMFTSVRGRTKIADNGLAETGTLRFSRVLNLYSPIDDKPIEFECFCDTSLLTKRQIILLENACRALRHVGMGRTRGLGNVEVRLEDVDSREQSSVNVEDLTQGEGEELSISYRVRFDAPLAVQEYLEDATKINARTVIGFFANRYIDEKKSSSTDEEFNPILDETFNQLFLDGTVKWSALTPIIQERASIPTPAMLMKLKNDNGRIINVFSMETTLWKGKKPTDLNGSYTVVDDDINMIYVASPESEINNHNNMRNHMENESIGLYMQEALQEGMVYGGYIRVPRKLLDSVKKLLSESELWLGRSKKTQYGKATILDIKISKNEPKKISLREGDGVIAVLESDLILQTEGRFVVDQSFVREYISGCTGLTNEVPTGVYDICRYHVLSGYNSMWKMQKPKIQAVKGGSIYCFKATETKEYPSEIMLGEYLQEGMGRIRLLSVDSLKNLKTVEKKEVMHQSKNENCDDLQIKNFEDLLLYKAVLEEWETYAFKFKQDDEKKEEKDRILRDIPIRRLRQILLDAKGPKSLYRMVDAMKTSDVSSESIGKKEKSKQLLESFYGLHENGKINLTRFLNGNKNLLTEFEKVKVNRNKRVIEKMTNNWKKPLFMLLHILHYEKQG